MKLSKSLFSGRWGIEREVLRVDSHGRLAKTPHPFPPENKQITVDFAEAQSELITGVHSSPTEALEELEALQSQLESSLGDELLWPFSLPGFWAAGEQVQVAQFGGEPSWEDQRQYRQLLAKQYGAARQTLSGIHLNYSFGPGHPGSDYFALARNFLRFGPILTYLLAGSPWLGAEYQRQLALGRPREAARGEVCGSRTASVRQGPLGYSLAEATAKVIDVRFDSLEEYLQKLGRALNSEDGASVLAHEREFYSPVRPKGRTKEKGRTLEALADSGVNYLEFRIFDLDPLAPLGISSESLMFVELFVLACSALSSPLLSPLELSRARATSYTLAECSLNREAGTPRSVRSLWPRMEPTLAELAALGGEAHQTALRHFQDIIAGRTVRGIENVVAQWKRKSGLDWGLERARLHKAWQSLELSTRLVIEEADRRGIQIRLVDASENFLQLEKDGKVQYIKQATRTGADSYIAALLMENKAATKFVLAEHGLVVPQGLSFVDLQTAMKARRQFVGAKLVVKPSATNFGDGVAILEADAPRETWDEALKTAFSLDKQVLVEEFAEGLEFRFLVIGGKTVAVLHRVPANVLGDGRHTIAELVKQKNLHPWRGEGYRKPLEKLRLDLDELTYLADQGLTPTSVPAEGARVFLRKNSNISTGGDSIDFTDAMPQRYKEVAEKAVSAVGAKICGLDMIIPNWRAQGSDAPYTILELNFNPALHIHAFPAEGQRRPVEAAVLDLLGM